MTTNRITLIQAQDRFIDRVNAIREPGRRSCGHMYNRSFRAAAQELRRYLTSIGIAEDAQGAIVADARDMAKLIKASDE
jgi:GMP synthase PP-ATPase subunit